MHTTSISLLVRLRQENAREAWARFARLYTPLLFYWARRIGLASEDAEDLAQDVLMVVMNKLHGFEHRGCGSFRAWLRTVAINKCRERLRREGTAKVRGNGQSMMDVADAAQSDPFWEVEYRQHLVARALTIMQAEFEPATWQACWQRIVEELPAKEVASNLGLSEGAVYVYTGRVLRRLREELGDLLD